MPVGRNKQEMEFYEVLDGLMPKTPRGVRSVTMEDSFIPVHQKLISLENALVIAVELNGQR